MKKPTKKEVFAFINKLRDLAPERALNFGDSLAIARLQAAHFRALRHLSDELNINLIWLIEQQAVPVQFVPSHVLDEDSGLTTDYLDDKLQVFINEGDSLQRQRFSLLHEFKHVLDFPHADQH